LEGGDPKRLSLWLSNQYRWIFADKVGRLLPRGTRRVYIAPDGELNFVPFAALISLDGKFLCEQLEINYVATGRDLLRRPEERAAEAGKLVFFGDPTFSTGKEEGVFAGLPGTRAEGSHLKALLPSLKMSGEFHLAGEATEARLRALHSPGILHLATHGFLTDVLPFGSREHSNPMFRSGVALAGASDTIRSWRAERPAPPADADGILLADEVSDLDLRETSLVCLSACMTARGEAHDGQGVFGLRRGFGKAGALHVLMTLWPVSDKETAEFMREFYRELSEGTYADTALALVQRRWLLRLREEKDTLEAVRIAAPFLLSSYGVDQD
jgi:CHAT domain-containing protein